MSHLETVRNRFADLVHGPEDQIDLVEAALLIAHTAFPKFDDAYYTHKLDMWAEHLRQGLSASPSAGDMVIGLNRILFEEQRFNGDLHNYYDLQNSFLNRVMDRKTGIPITLSLIYCEVGRRAGFTLQGISLPGHFIAALFHAGGTLYIDPFNRGEVLTEEECCQMVRVRYGPEAALDVTWKIPAGKKDILKRMLRNLKAIYQNMGSEMQAFEMIQWILAVDPDALKELKERGLLYEALGNDTFAIRDLERYLALSPASTDTREIMEKIDKLIREHRWVH